MKTELIIYRESKIRSLIKGMTWRVLATLTTITLAYLLTGDVHKALEIGFYEFFVKFVVYYLHERLWQAVPRGTVRQIVEGKQ